MKIPAAPALLAIICFLPLLHAESEADLRYRLRSQEILIHNRSEEIGRAQQENAELRRQLAAVRTQTNVGAALNRQAKAAADRHDELVSDTTEIADQVKASNDSALERAASLTAVGERAASSADRSAEKAQVISDRQLTQIWGMVIVILGLVASGLRSWLKENKTHELVRKVETNSNGNVARALAAKDAELLATRQAADALAAKDATIRELMQHKIDLLERLGKQGRRR